MVGPRKAIIFYHVCGEIALELFLVKFWITSVTDIASYASQVSSFTHIIIEYTTGNPSDDQSRIVKDLVISKDFLTAIAVLGVVALYVVNLSYFLSNPRDIRGIPHPHLYIRIRTYTPSALALANAISLSVYLKSREDEKKSSEDVVSQFSEV